MLSDENEHTILHVKNVNVELLSHYKHAYITQKINELQNNLVKTKLA